MKFCKDCVHCTPAKSVPKPKLAAGVPPHTGWLCNATGFNVVTGDRVSREEKLCVDMRAGTAPCGNGALLFSAKANNSPR